MFLMLTGFFVFFVLRGQHKIVGYVMKYYVWVAFRTMKK